MCLAGPQSLISRSRLHPSGDRISPRIAASKGGELCGRTLSKVNRGGCRAILGDWCGRAPGAQSPKVAISLARGAGGAQTSRSKRGSSVGAAANSEGDKIERRRKGPEHAWLMDARGDNVSSASRHTSAARLEATAALSRRGASYELECKNATCPTHGQSPPSSHPSSSAPRVRCSEPR